MISTRYRSEAAEIMDDFTMEGEMLRDALDKIARINQLLGGNRLTLRGVESLLINLPKTQLVTIVDVGCGNGDMLRALAEYAKDTSRNFNLIGIDANDFTIRHAAKLSVSYQDISYRCEDIFDASFNEVKADIFLCTLTLHHFRDGQIVTLITDLYRNCDLGIVVNDLHRSKVAYYLFKVLCALFGLNKMSREDGLVSILRGFKKEDLQNYSKALKLKKYSLRWKWAFRYQWIINKI